MNSVDFKFSEDFFPSKSEADVDLVFGDWKKILEREKF